MSSEVIDTLQPADDVHAEVAKSPSMVSRWRAWFFGPSVEAKVARIALGLLAFFLAIFGINAAVVGIAMYTVAQQALERLSIAQLAIGGLCQECSSIDLKGRLDGGRAMNLFRLTLEEPLELQLFCLPMDKEPMLTVKVPPFELGKAIKTFDWTGPNALPLRLNPAFRFDTAIDKVVENKGKLTARIKAKVVGKTSSFWIPIRLDRHVDVDYDIDFIDLLRKQQEARSRSSGSSSPGNAPSLLDHFEVLEEVDGSLEVKLGVRVPTFPEFLAVQLPPTALQVGVDVDGSVGPVADIGTGSHLELSSRTPLVNLSIKAQNAYLQHLKRLIQMLLQGRKDFSMSLASTAPDQSTCHWHAWLSSLRTKQRYVDIESLMHQARSTSSAVTPMLADQSQELLRVAFITVADNKIVMEMRVLKSFVRSLTGFDVRKLRGQMPVIAMQNVLAAQSVDNPDSLVAHLMLEHVLVDDDNFLVFRVSFSLTDAAKLSEFVYGLLSRDPHVVAQQVSGYRRLLLRGLDNTLLSSLVSALAIEVDLTRNIPAVHFSGHGPQDAGANGEEAIEELAFGGYSFAVPSRLDHVALFDAKTTLTQDAGAARFSLQLALPTTPLLANRPFLTMQWPDVSLQVKKDGTTLMTAEIAAGSLRATMAPMSALFLLHDGTVNAAVMMERTADAFDSAWHALVHDIFVKPEPQDLDLATVLPPPPMLGLQVAMQGAVIDLELATPSFAYLLDPPANTKVARSYPHVRIDKLHEQTLMASVRLVNVPPASEEPHKSRITVHADIASDVRVAWGTTTSGVKVAVGAGKRTIVLENLTPASVVSADTGSDWQTISLTIVDPDVVAQLATDPQSEMACTPLSDAMVFDRVLQAALSNFPIHLRQPAAAQPPADNRTYSDDVVDVQAQVASADWGTLQASLLLNIPMPAATGSFNPAGLLVVEWGQTELTLDAYGHRATVSVSPAKLALGPPGIRLADASNEIRLDLAVTLDPQRRFTAGDGRRILEHCHNYIYRDGIPDGPFKTDLVARIAGISDLRLRTRFLGTGDPGLVSFGLPFLLRHAKALLERPAEPKDRLWRLLDEWYADIRLRQPHSDVDGTAVNVVHAPCFIPQMCLSPALLNAPSYRQPLLRVETTLFKGRRAMCELFGSMLGNYVLARLSLPAYPRRLRLRFQSAADILISGSINGIDISEVFVSHQDFTVDQVATVHYAPPPVDGLLSSEIETAIAASEHTAHVDIRLAQFYHDATGIVRHILLDSVGRLVLDEPATHAVVAGSTVVDQPLHYTPMAMLATNERLPSSNLLSTLGCLLVRENVGDPVLSAVEAQSPTASVPHASSTRLEVRVAGLMLQNPTRNLNIVLEHTLSADVIYHHDADHNDYAIAGGQLELPGGRPLRLQANARTPVTATGRLDMPDSLDRAVLRDFIAKSMQRRAMHSTLHIHLLPTLEIHLMLQYGDKPGPTELIDQAETSYIAKRMAFNNDKGPGNRVAMDINGLYLDIDARIGQLVDGRRQSWRHLPFKMAFGHSACRPLGVQGRIDDFVRCAREHPAAHLEPGERMLATPTTQHPMERVKGDMSSMDLDLGVESVMRDGLCRNATGIISFALVNDARTDRCVLEVPFSQPNDGGVRMSRDDFPPLPFGFPDDDKVLYKTDFDSCRLINTSFHHQATVRPAMSFQHANMPAPTIHASTATVTMTESALLLHRSALLSVQQRLSSDSVWVVEFEMYMEESVDFALVLSEQPLPRPHNGSFGIVGMPGVNAVALAMSPSTGLLRSTACELHRLSTHDTDNVGRLARKGNTTLPNVYMGRWLKIRMMHLLGRKQLVMDVSGEGDLLPMRTLMTLDRRDPSAYTRRTQRGLRDLLHDSPAVYFAVTCKGKRPLSIRNVQVHLPKPDLANSEVFWLQNQAALPWQAGSFFLRLVDEYHHDVVDVSRKSINELGKANGPALMIQLRMVDPRQPRRLIVPVDDSILPSPFDPRPDPNDLMRMHYSPNDEVLPCSVIYHPVSGLYECSYAARFPGRYVIYASADDGTTWTLVNWHSIYVRYHW